MSDPKTPPHVNEQVVLREVDRALRRWQRAANIDRLAQFALSATAIVAAALIASGLIDAHTGLSRAAALVAAVSTTLLSSFSFGAKADRWRAAWRTAKLARVRHEAGLATVGDLFDAYAMAENSLSVLNVTSVQLAPTEQPAPTRGQVAAGTTAASNVDRVAPPS